MSSETSKKYPLHYYLPSFHNILLLLRQTRKEIQDWQSRVTSHLGHTVFLFFNFLFYISVELAAHVALVSGARHSDSAIHRRVSMLFQILFPFRSLQRIEQSPLCSTEVLVGYAFEAQLCGHANPNWKIWLHATSTLSVVREGGIQMQLQGSACATRDCADGDHTWRWSDYSHTGCTWAGVRAGVGRRRD